MKKILCFSLAIFILTISILIYCPIRAFASYPDDYYSLSKPYNQGLGLSSADAQAAVNSHKDIADSRGILCFQYTPTEKYNWTVNTKITQNIHLSDNQLKQLLMSKHAISAGFLNFMYGTVNSNAFRGFISGVGVATRTDSDTLLGIADKITGNYNYLDAIDYNEDTQTITMSNDNSSVDELRKEIKKYYYDSIGIRFINPTDNHNPAYLIELNRSLYDYEEDYISDFNALSQYDYAVGTSYGDYTTRLISGFDKNSYSYCYLGQLGNNSYIYFLDKDMNVVNDSVIKIFNAQSYGSGNERIDLDYSFKSVVPLGSQLFLRLYSKDNSSYKEVTFYNGYTMDRSCFYSKDNKPFIYFSSYEKLYNFLNGSQTAYLSSQINKIGEDISFSINDMNENLGSKMDTLIDTINDKKGSMTADELQNAIDKGLEDLNKTSEDIKDNTEEMNSKLDSILEALNAQNQTLLAILGVTKKIADTVDDIDEKTDYNSIISTISTIFNAVQCALLYGQNTLKDSDSSAQAQAVSYSDDIAVYSDSSGTYKPKVLNMDLRSGIFGHFPFSMIYHMYDWCAAFVAEAKAPVFTYNYGFLVGDKDNPELTVSIDLSQYEDWRDVAASFMKLAFTLAVAFGSYKRFKEVML